ncbi:MAG: hypothetical protein ACJ76N_09765 [Thermoanaerobaculia bacterium]
MPKLTIDLQTGFSNDQVILRVAGAEVLKKSEVTTNLAISLAESCQTEVKETSVDVEVLVPSRGLKGAVKLDTTRTPYLGVSIVEGQLELKPSETMLFYF